MVQSYRVYLFWIRPFHTYFLLLTLKSTLKDESLTIQLIEVYPSWQREGLFFFVLSFKKANSSVHNGHCETCLHASCKTTGLFGRLIPYSARVDPFPSWSLPQSWLGCLAMYARSCVLHARTFIWPILTKRVLPGLQRNITSRYNISFLLRKRNSEARMRTADLHCEWLTP